MEIQTRVGEVHGEWARLVCEQAGQCDLCGSGGGCGLSRRSACRVRHLMVPGCRDRTRPLVAGDVVLVSVADGDIVRAAALSYLLPLAGLLTGAGLAQTMGMGDGMAFLAGFAGALAGVGCGRRAGVHRFRLILAPRETDNADA